MLNMYFYGFSFFIFSCLLFFLGLFFYYNNFILLFQWVICGFNSMDMELVLYLDFMSLLFLSVVFLISSMVMFYSIDYMNDEVFKDRFVYLINLFIFSMMMMILSPNIMSILLGWDGLGLISYCLVIYYQNYMSYNSGMLTILCNRIGDIGLILSISMLMFYGSWNLMLFKLDNNINLILCFMILAMFTKSAQIPFSSWLPAAMAAPTPISALVHSSTLVTAGVFLLIRYSFMFNNELMGYILLISSFTMFMSGLIANFEFDLKKIIALSTLSQLGLMMSILSFGQFNLAFFHLITHAMFKSLLFLCAGSLIHSLMNIQDIRFYGGINLKCSFLSMSFLIAMCSLSGFPFLAGFYSKDLIMEYMFMNSMSILSLMFLMIGTVLTVSYNMRLVMYLFFGKMNYLLYNNINDSKIMNLSMILLLIMSVISGSMFSWLYFDQYFIILNVFNKFLMISMCILGLFIGFLFFKFNFLNFKILDFFNSMFFLNYLYKHIFKYPMFFSLYMYMNLEKCWLENYGGMFMFKFLKFMYMNIFYVKYNLIWMLKYVVLFSVFVIFMI